MAQDVARPRDAEGFGEGGDFLVPGAGRNDPAAAGQRSEPRCEIVGDRDDAARGGFRLTGPHFDDAAVEVHGRPVEPGDCRAPDSCERPVRKQGGVFSGALPGWCVEAQGAVQVFVIVPLTDGVQENREVRKVLSYSE